MVISWYQEVMTISELKVKLLHMLLFFVAKMVQNAEKSLLLKINFNKHFKKLFKF